MYPSRASFVGFDTFLEEEPVLDEKNVEMGQKEGGRLSSAGIVVSGRARVGTTKTEPAQQSLP